MFWLSTVSLISTLAQASPGDSSFPVVSNGLANIQVSSVYEPNHDESRIRLHFDQNREGSRGWAAAHTDTNQWVQLSTHKAITWSQIVTQGRGDIDEWVTSFTVDYTENGVDWLSYDNSRVLHANFDRDSLAEHNLIPPIVARSIKINPKTFQARPSLRLEAYVSELSANTTLVASPHAIPAIKSGLRVTASSVFSPSYDESRIRLHFDQQREGSAGWIPSSSDLQQWVQVSSVEPKQWTKVSTQGRGDYPEWLTSYYVTYTEDGRDWHMVNGGETFTGNSDQNSVVTHEFETPFMARAVRLHPMAWNGAISFRMEFYFSES